MLYIYAEAEKQRIIRAKCRDFQNLGPLRFHRLAFQAPHSTIEQSYVVYPKVVKPGMCVFLCHYLHVQLTYLNELYGECNGTARACTKSGHQVLLSDFFECLGMRIIYYIHVSMYIHIHCIILPDVTYVHIHVSIWKTLLLTYRVMDWASSPGDSPLSTDTPHGDLRRSTLVV